MEHGTLVFDDVSGARWITVSRPEKLNALNRDVVADLERAVAEARDDAAVKVIVLTGAGEKAFVAGADLPLERALGVEAMQFGLCFASEDMHEGTAAFLGKRQASFTGR